MPSGPCLNLDKIDEISNRKNAAPADVSEEEEYAVYNALINHGDKNRIIVIYANTTISKGFNQSYLLESMPSLEPKTLEDFEAKNDQSYPLKNLFNLRSKYVIVNESQIYEVFPVDKKNEPGVAWREFYERCRGSPGIQYLSRVGFNAEMDQALVEVGYNFPYMMAGGGNLQLLEKENGTWNITNKMMTWVS